ncbi:MAG: hypothetical protein ACD_81C00126G0023 [uncultured bacterium]|uniref:Uncharacterized protein n=2 Tax=Candidatus Wolfeibacteriota TaxID=1752735 RepID=A0A0G1HBC3_9BACT|nr:MAG: hypothetical protein ACD_81C00126G0023 [uncultured bacterium]KKR12902.1 MAG: hypothetical protein UT41_C0001G0446 [Candidatus Wolfebacteria bacterium GW2011_GWC2_39_22]KKT43833.1 MAG: hypothetical protein UW32_C0001G0425 [Candidatus Wolfebacteria bacterium GW2011_GWE2_44_13]HBI25440.1 hypothetical protein [Candidatus Wolfebacteria bacterium]
MAAIQKDFNFFKKRRKQAVYVRPKVILVDVDGTVIKPRIKMYSMSEEKLGKQAVAKIEKDRIKPLRQQMIKRQISFEEYLLGLSKIDIELGEYYQDYKQFFFDLVKQGMLNEPLIRALGILKKKHNMKVIFLTSNLRIYGEIISDYALQLLGEKGTFDGAVGAEYLFDKKGKAVGVKSLISHDDAKLGAVSFMTKETAIKKFFKVNKVTVRDEEIAVVSDADTALMKLYGLGGLVLYPLSELSSQFKEIEYIRNAREGLFDFCVDYAKGKDLDIAQKKWELVLSDPSILRMSNSEIKTYLKNND